MPAVWVFLPVLGTPILHAPVLRWNLLPALRRPLNRRLFGENKTWRGALVMNGGTVAAAVVLHRLPAYRRRLPRPVAKPTLRSSARCWASQVDGGTAQ